MPNDEDQLIEGYERNIPEELREMFYQRWQEVKERTTQTKIRALEVMQQEQGRLLKEQDNILTSFFKQLTVSLSPLVKFDEKQKEKAGKK